MLSISRINVVLSLINMELNIVICLALMQKEKLLKKAMSIC